MEGVKMQKKTHIDLSNRYEFFLLFVPRDEIVAVFPTACDCLFSVQHTVLKSDHRLML